MKNDGTLPSELDELISKCGLPLIDGVLGVGFAREAALNALDILQERGRSAVLGGDVYELVGGKPKVSYDNWYSDPQPGEEWSDYVVRSIKHSRDYITNYKCETEEGCLFSLVVRTRP